jgi:vacuolar-type H+-ATPase subunit E/Vma4
MSVEHIREAILADAGAEAERIAAEARSRHDERLAAARAALEKEFAARLEKAKLDAETEARRRVILRRAEHNLALLKQRNDMLDALFAQAGPRLAALPDDGYRAVMEKWMRSLPADVGGELGCNERDEMRLGPVIEKLNRERPPEARLRAARHDQPLTGGVLFRAEKFEIDLSVDARVQRLREALAPEVSRIVFTGDVTV